MKIKTYVLMVAKTFPHYHPRKGQKTLFSTAIVEQKKIHTIRGNYALWKKRIDEVNEGKAILVLKEWTERPYHSPQFTFHKFSKEDGIGVEKLELMQFGWFIKDSDVTSAILAKNDGLFFKDFKACFKTYDLSEPMAIIHFTGFRYEN